MIMRKIRKIIIITAIIGLVPILSSCKTDHKETYKEEYKITNINIFKDSPVWELALAVKGEKTGTIEKIAKNKYELLNYQEPKYGATLLLWSVGMEKYKSAEALLKCGADPNITSKTDTETPLFLAAGFSWIDYVAKKDAKYVKLLLKYGADPNKNYHTENKHTIESGTSPLMNSIGCGIEKTRALVEAGADINHKTTQTRDTAATGALRYGGSEYAHYLIVENKANVSDPYYRRKSYGNEDPNEKFFPVNILRGWLCDIDSKEYRRKMEIVEEFARQGVNYWETKIPSNRMDQIKKIYPDTWEEYIKRY